MSWQGNDSSSASRQQKRPNQEYIYNQLRNRRKRKEDRDRRGMNVDFLIEADVRQIWSDAAISTVFNSRELEQTETTFIRDHFCKLLSTLVLIRFPLSLEWFEENLLALADIPKATTPRNGSTGAWRDDSNLPFLTHEDLEFLGEASLKDSFYEQQFILLPVEIFEKVDGEPQKEDPRQRLPFEDVGFEKFVGGYGTVQQVRISAWYLKYQGGHVDPQGTDVACKKFAKKFTLELENLKTIKGARRSHKRIMEHIAAIEHGDDHLILFPFAKHLDLEIFLHSGYGPDTKHYNFSTTFPELSKSNIFHQVFHQAAELADALAWLHEGYSTDAGVVHGVHLDLKPNNILIDQDRTGKSLVGKWMISDFGISKFEQTGDLMSSSDNYRSQVTLQVNPGRNEGTYSAPEVQGYSGSSKITSRYKTGPNLVGRRSDIWAFGCILTEILTFALGENPDEGRRLVEEFQDVRLGKSGKDLIYDDDAFFKANLGPDSKHDQGYEPATAPPWKMSFEVRPEVTKWLKEKTSSLTMHGDWSQCCHGTILDILKVETQERPDGQRLNTMMQHLEEHLNASGMSPRERCPYLSFDGLLADAISLSGSENTAARDILTILQTGNVSPLYQDGPSHTSLSLSNSQYSSSHGNAESTTEDYQRPPKPQDAHGIMIDPQPRVKLLKPTFKFIPEFVEEKKEKRSLLSRKQNVPVVDVSISPDGQLIAILQGGCVRLLKYSSLISPSMQDTFVCQTQPIHLSQPQGWKSLAIAGSYLAVWGYSRETKSKLLELFDVRSGTNVSPFRQEELKLLKLVALSPNGLVALVLQSKIIFSIIGSRRDDSATNDTDLHPRYGKMFTNAAFNDDGSFLYAWAFGGSQEERFDHLYQWEVSGVIVNKTPILVGRYKVTNPLSTPRSLIPYNQSFGAIIEAPDHTFFPAQAKNPSQTGKSKKYPRYSITLGDALATCLFNNHSMLTISKKEVKEYAIIWGDLHTLRESQPERLFSLQTSPSDRSKIRAFRRDDGNIIVVVCNIDGSIEIATFSRVESNG